MGRANSAHSAKVKAEVARDASALAQGYRRLLELLSEDPVEAGKQFDALRRRLVRLMGWKGALVPEDVADETLDRVAQQLGRGLEIQTDDPFRYICGVAFRVVQESFRQQQRGDRLDEALLQQPSPEAEAELASLEELRLGCLDQCLGGLDPEKRDLILGYYQGERSAKIAARRSLAEELGIRAQTLRLRALRIRESLESCVVRCLRR